jgi:hypothetical protein
VIAVEPHPYSRYLADGTEEIARLAAEYEIPAPIVEAIFTAGQFAALERQDLLCLAAYEDFGRQPQVTL